MQSVSFKLDREGTSQTQPCRTFWGIWLWLCYFRVFSRVAQQPVLCFPLTVLPEVCVCVVPGFELRALHLLGRHCTTGTIPHTPTPFCYGYFGGWVSLFAQVGLTMIPLFMLPDIPGMTGACHHAQIFSFVIRIFTNLFFQGNPRAVILLILVSHTAGDDRCAPLHPDIGWDGNRTNFLPRLARNCSRLDVSLPSS
jgi:hypothetical protein